MTETGLKTMTYGLKKRDFLRENPLPACGFAQFDLMIEFKTQILLRGFCGYSYNYILYLTTVFEHAILN